MPERGSMEPSQPAEPKVSFKAAASLIVAIAVVAIVLVFLPAYRIFFAISLGIGVIVAGVLYLWNQYRPIKEEDVDHHQRPLGLDDDLFK
jgi:hypothetical protein